MGWVKIHLWKTLQGNITRLTCASRADLPVRRVYGVCNTKTYLSRPLEKHAFCQAYEVCQRANMQSSTKLSRISLSAESLVKQFTIGR